MFLCVLVSPCLVSVFLALLHNHCYSLQKAGHFYLARGSWTSRNKNAVFSPKLKSTANFFSSSPGGKPLFPRWEITGFFAQSARGVEETIQLPTLLGQQCWELSFAPCWRCVPSVIYYIGLTSRACKRPATRELNLVRTELLYNY